MSRHDIISVPNIRSSDYRSLAELRYEIRKFLHFSERASRAARLEPTQHQFLLALKGLSEDLRPNIGVLAERLQIRPNSAVELVNRLVKRGLVRRRRNGNGNGNGNGNDNDNSIDHREVLLDLTAKGEKVLRKLSLHHRQELQQTGPALMSALQAVLRPSHPARRKLEADSHRHLAFNGGRKGAANALAG